MESRGTGWLQQEWVRRVRSELSSKLARDSAVYVVGTGLLAAGNFFLVPVYTRFLSPERYGVVALLEILVATLMTCAQLGLGVSYIKWFADVAVDMRPRLLATALLLAGGAGAVLGAVVVVLSHQLHLQRWVGWPIDDLGWVLAGIVVFEAIHALLLAHFIAAKQAVAFMAATLLRLLGTVVGGIGLVAYAGLGVDGVFYGRLLGTLVGAIVGLVLARQSIRVGFDRGHAAGMLRYGLPTLWTALTGGLLFDLSEREFVHAYVSLSDVGSYGAAAKVANIMGMLVIQPFGYVWGGFMFQIARRPDAPRVYVTVLTSAFIVVVAIGSMLIGFGPVLFSVIVPQEYGRGLIVFPLVVLTHGFRILEYLIALRFFLTHRTRVLAVVYSATLIVSLLFNAVMVPRAGMIAAAGSRVLALGLALVVMELLGRRHYPLPHDRWAIAGAFVPWVVVSAAMVSQGPSLELGSWIRGAVIALLVAGWAGALVVRLLRRAGVAAPAAGRSDQRAD